MYCKNVDANIFHDKEAYLLFLAQHQRLSSLIPTEKENIVTSINEEQIASL